MQVYFLILSPNSFAYSARAKGFLQLLIVTEHLTISVRYRGNEVVANDITLPYIVANDITFPYIVANDITLPYIF